MAAISRREFFRKTATEAAVAGLEDIGMTQMSTASIGSGNGGNTPTLDQVKAAAEEYNKIAAEAAKAGLLQQALHNEGFENSTVDGRRTCDILLELLDPKLVKMQFQMSSMRVLGDPVEYFTKYPGRFISMHLQGVNLAPASRTTSSSRTGISRRRASRSSRP